MLIMTAKLSKGKLALCLLGAALLLFLVLKLVSGGEEAPTPPTDGIPEPTGISGNEERLAYLTACGYTAEPEPVQTQEVSIPKEFNEVFTRYNELQRSQGFDLEPYAGKRAKRYVYSVTDAEGCKMRATLVIYQDTVIAADVSSTEGGGFMRALLPQEQNAPTAAAAAPSAPAPADEQTSPAPETTNPAPTTTDSASRAEE